MTKREFIGINNEEIKLSNNEVIYIKDLISEAIDRLHFENKIIKNLVIDRVDNKISFYNCKFYNVKFTNCNLSNWSFFENTTINSCHFSNCKFDSSLFVSSKINSTLFEKCKIKRLNTENSEFNNSIFTKCKFNDSLFIIENFQGNKIIGELYNSRFYSRLEQKSKLHIDLSEAILKHMDFYYCDLSEAILPIDKSILYISDINLKVRNIINDLKSMQDKKKRDRILMQIGDYASKEFFDILLNMKEQEYEWDDLFDEIKSLLIIANN